VGVVTIAEKRSSLFRGRSSMTKNVVTCLRKNMVTPSVALHISVRLTALFYLIVKDWLGIAAWKLDVI